MSADLAAEALAAITGLFPKGPPTITDLLAAEGLGARWEGRIRTWLKGKQQPFKWKPPPDDQEVLHNRVIANLDRDEVAAWLQALGDGEVGIAYAAVLLRGREHLVSIWPAIEIGSVVPEVLPLSLDDYQEWFSQYRVIDDPDALLDDTDAWVLSRSVANAFKIVFPELYAALNNAMTMALIDHVTAGRALSWQQEDMIRVLRGLDPEAAIELPGVTSDEPEPSRPKSFTVNFEATRTPAEQVSARV